MPLHIFFRTANGKFAKQYTVTFRETRAYNEIIETEDIELIENEY